MNRIPFLILGLAALSILSFDWMPLALLTPIRKDLGLSVPQMGAAIGWFGFLTFIGSIGSFWLRRFFCSLTILRGILIALSIVAFTLSLFPYTQFFILSRLVGGCVFGAFWTVSTASSFSLREKDKRSALASLYVGNAVTVAVILPFAVLGEKLLGWRILFGIIGACAALLSILLSKNFFKELESFLSLRSKEESLLKVIKSGYSTSGFDVLITFAALGVMFAGAGCVYPYFRVLLEKNTYFVPEHFSYIFALEGVMGIIGVRTLKFLQDRKPSSLGIVLIGLIFFLALLSACFAALTFGSLSYKTILTCITIAFWGFGLNSMAFLWPLWLAHFERVEPFCLIAFKIGFVQLAVMVGTWTGAYSISLQWGVNFAIGSIVLLLAACLSYIAVRKSSQQLA